VFVHEQPLCAAHVVEVANVPHNDAVPLHESEAAFHAHPIWFWQVVWLVSNVQLVGFPVHIGVVVHPRQAPQPYT
jgi:hypothetical protein